MPLEEQTPAVRAIAAKNDMMRTMFAGCKVVFTPAVQALSSSDLVKLCALVQTFTAFTPDNDPYGEHDFGKVTLAPKIYFWKFDYYDDGLEGFEPDGKRVLTIMREDEY